MKLEDPISRRKFLSLSAAGLATPCLAWVPAHQGSDVPTLLDHFILGCNEMERGIDFVEKATAVRAAFGGVHPGRGTQNALLSLGERRYLEIMAPDPKQSVQPQIAKLRGLKEPRIVGWAAHPGNLGQFAAKLREAKLQFEGPRDGSRERPDGKVFHWKTLTLKDDHGGLLPFLIEWSADSIHPSADAPKGSTLRRFEAITPETEDLLHFASLIDLDLYVGVGNEPMLKATIAGPKGELELSS